MRYHKVLRLCAYSARLNVWSRCFSSDSIELNVKLNEKHKRRTTTKIKPVSDNKEKAFSKECVSDLMTENTKSFIIELLPIHSLSYYFCLASL